MFIICGGRGGNPAKRKSLKYRRGSNYEVSILKEINGSQIKNARGQFF